MAPNMSHPMADAIAARLTQGALPAELQGFGPAEVAAAAAFVAGTTKLALTGDDAIGSVAIPFKFPYFGSNFSTLYLSTNGFASVTSLSSSYFANGTIPTTTAPNGGLMPFWDDLVVDSNAGIYTATTGTTGNRSFIVEWRNVRPYAQSSSSERIMRLTMRS